MISLFRSFIFALLGLAFAAFGCLHAVAAYPGPEVFGRFSDALPTLLAVASFAFGLLAVVAGLTLLAPAAASLRRRQGRAAPSNLSAPADRRGAASRPVRPESFEEYPEEYEGNGYYPGADERYPDPPDARSRRNGEYEDPRRARSYR